MEVATSNNATTSNVQGMFILISEFEGCSPSCQLSSKQLDGCNAKHSEGEATEDHHIPKHREGPDERADQHLHKAMQLKELTGVTRENCNRSNGLNQVKMNERSDQHLCNSNSTARWQTAKVQTEVTRRHDMTASFCNNYAIHVTILSIDKASKAACPLSDLVEAG